MIEESKRDSDFRPDTGTLEVFKIPSGHGVRVDSAALGPGSVIKLHYDSMVCKCISHASDFQKAVKVMTRALLELEIKGVETNVDFLIRVLQIPAFRNGTYWTTFLEDTASLKNAASHRPDSIEKLLAFLGDAVLNGTRVIGQEVSDVSDFFFLAEPE